MQEAAGSQPCKQEHLFQREVATPRTDRLSDGTSSPESGLYVVMGYLGSTLGFDIAFPLQKQRVPESRHEGTPPQYRLVSASAALCSMKGSIQRG